MARIRTIKPDFWSDGKVVTLSAEARLLFIGSWNFALCDDGHLPDDAMGLKLKVLPADAVDPFALLEELLSAGVIAQGTTPDGRSYLHIPRLRDHQKVDNRWTPRCFVCASQKPADPQPASSVPTETRASLDESHRDSPEPPEPHRSKGKESKGKENVSDSADAEPTRDDVESLCSHLQRRLIENGRKNHTTITDAWRTSARLLIDRDKRPVPEIHAVIDWCQGDSFWKSNIGGMPKMREQYDTLVMQATNRGGLRVAASNGERTWTTAELDAVLGVDYWRLPPYPDGMDADQGWEWEQRVKREHRAERIRQAEAKLGRSA